MSKRWYLLSVVPLLLGGVIAFLVGTNMYDEIAGMQRVTVPGEGVIRLDKGEHVVFYEGAGTSGLRCAVADELGAPAELSQYGGKQKYSMGGYSGYAVFDLEVPHDGAYTISCEGSFGAVAIGDGLGTTIVGLVFAILGGVFGALIVVVVVWRRRKRAQPR